MSKKRFTEGLESIFGDAHEETFERGGLLVETEEKPKKAPRKRRSSSRKSFTTDLDSLLDNALTETIEEKVEEQTKTAESKSKSVQHTKRPKKPLTGLDALIRQTIETSSMEYNPTGTKRVTFTFDKKKIEKLKRIARIEKAYLKDIIGDLVSEYIDEYENKKGDVNRDIN